MGMEKTWRWYGPNDPVTLRDIRQTGATGIVTALHHVPIGEVWTPDEIQERQNIIREAGLEWTVIESIPVHEDIKQAKPERDAWIEKYKQSIKNVGKAGVKVLTYNWMPVVDWTRTNLSKNMDDGAKALEFNLVEFIIFDVLILKRPGAEKSYSDSDLSLAHEVFKQMSEEDKALLQNNIIAGLPGGQEGYSLDAFLKRLNEYAQISEDQYRENLKYFLEAIVPTAIEAGVRLAIHPDDPPVPLFGLPRVVSTEKDLEYLTSVIDDIHNGLCVCTGSLGVRADNDLAGIITRFGSKINFLHFRSTARDGNGNFHEARHLEGDVDMFSVVLAALREQKRREKEGRADIQIPMRPDHGHLMMDDQNKKTNPGYSAIGRMKGLAELCGLEMGIEKSGIV